jgi:glycosyltransferase involved in cell wall biosynthesis
MGKVKPQKRGDYVVFASRLAKHKNIDHVLQAVKDNNVRLKIISSTRSQTVIDTIARMGIKKQVDFLTQIGDQEKFRVISESRALINASTLRAGVYGPVRQ